MKVEGQGECPKYMMKVERQKRSFYNTLETGSPTPHVPNGRLQVSEGCKLELGVLKHTSAQSLVAGMPPCVLKRCLRMEFFAG